MRRRIIIVDPGLRDYCGHYFETDMAIAKAVQRAGFHCTILGNRELEPGEMGNVHVLPQYSVGIWSVLSGPFHQWPSNVRAVSSRIFQETVNFLRADPPQPGDIVYLPNIAQGQLLAAAMLAEFLENTGVRLVLMFRYSRQHLISTVTRQVFARLKASAAKGQVRLVSDSEGIAGILASYTDLPVAILPIPIDVDWHVEDAEQRHMTGRAYRVVSPGNPRAEKGIFGYLEAIRILTMSVPRGGFEFSVQTNDADDAVARKLKSFRNSAATNVEFIDHSLDAEAYRRLILSADAVVLPYHASAYAVRTSGIFLEAVIAGKPVVCTQGTWMAGLLRKFENGIAIERPRGKDIAAAIGELRKEREAFAARARAARKHWSKIHSAVNFVACLCQIAGGDDSEPTPAPPP